MENNRRLMNIDELMEYTRMGRNVARKWGAEHNVVIRVGRRVLYDRKRVDEVLDSLSEKAQ